MFAWIIFIELVVIGIIVLIVKRIINRWPSGFF